MTAGGLTAVAAVETDTADASGDGARARSRALAGVLRTRYPDADAETLLRAMIEEEFPGRIALVSSFGAEAAVLLHMVAEIAPATPVIFLNTGKLFGETLRYRDGLVRRCGLTDVRSIQPDLSQVEAVDPDGVLWYGNPDMCCFVRKVEPLRRALEGFDASITGRKRFQGGERAGMAAIECDDDGRIKINPLAGWDKAAIDAYFARHELPRHPLEADGFLSIGCMPCTDRVKPGENARAGRWRHADKTECGIHLSRAHWKMNGID
jgi:phosphoadenosine phosphosulfate reductase